MIRTIFPLATIAAFTVSAAGLAVAQTPSGPGEWRVGIDPANKRVSLYASNTQNADMRVVCTPAKSAFMMRIPKQPSADNTAQIVLSTDAGAKITSPTIIQQRDSFTIVTAIDPKAFDGATTAIARAKKQMILRLEQSGAVLARYVFKARYSTPAAAAFENACAKQRN